MPKQCHLTPPPLLRDPSHLTPQGVAQAALEVALQVPIDEDCTPLKTGLTRLAPPVDLDQPWVTPAAALGGVGLVYLAGTEMPRRYGLPIAQTLRLGPVVSHLNVTTGPRFSNPTWNTNTQLRLSDNKLTLRYAGSIKEPVGALGLTYDYRRDLSLSADWKQRSGLTAKATLKVNGDLSISGSYAQQGNEWRLAVSGRF